MGEGGLLAILIGHCVLCPLTYCSPFTRVSFGSCLPSLSKSRPRQVASFLCPSPKLICESLSQMFICLKALNLNGRLLSILSTKIADDWTRFCTKYKFRASCVLVCYSSWCSHGSTFYRHSRCPCWSSRKSLRFEFIAICQTMPPAGAPMSTT